MSSQTEQVCMCDTCKHIREHRALVNTAVNTLNTSVNTAPVVAVKPTIDVPQPVVVVEKVTIVNKDDSKKQEELIITPHVTQQCPAKPQDITKYLNNVSIATKDAEHKSVLVEIPRHMLTEMTFTTEQGCDAWTHGTGTTFYNSNYRTDSWSFFCHVNHTKMTRDLRDHYWTLYDDKKETTMKSLDDFKFDAILILLDIYHIAEHYQYKHIGELAKSMNSMLLDWVYWPEYLNNVEKRIEPILHGKVSATQRMVCNVLIRKYPNNVITYYMCPAVVNALCDSANSDHLMKLYADRYINTKTFADYPQLLEGLLDVERIYKYYSACANKEVLKQSLYQLDRLCDNTEALTTAIAYWEHLMLNYADYTKTYKFGFLRIAVKNYTESMTEFIKCVVNKHKKVAK
jgi:hypothetical protein